MPATIRLATQADIPYLHHHWNESGWVISLSDAAKQLERTDFFQYMIELDSKVIGDIHYGNLENNGAEIGVYIRNTIERGKGYGTQAIMLMIDLLFAHCGYNEIVLNTSTDNYRMRYIAEEKLKLTPILHENILQEQGGTYEDYIEYRLKNPMGGNK